MRRLRRVGPGQGRCPHDLLRPARPAAPRSGIGRHRHRRRLHGARAQGRGPCDPGVFRQRHCQPQGRPGHRPRALRHSGWPRLGRLPAPPVHHRRRHHRPGPQRHARELRLAAPSAHRPGRSLHEQHRLRGGHASHRLLHAEHEAHPRGHPLHDGAARGRLCHGAHQRRIALCLPRPQRHPSARAGQAAQRRRLVRGKRDLRLRHPGCRVCARGGTRRGAAHQRRGSRERACGACAQEGPVHLRARVLRASRLRHGRCHRAVDACEDGRAVGMRERCRG